MYQHCFPAKVILLFMLCVSAFSCATTDNDQAMQDHYDALEQQQLSELESEIAERKRSLLRPAKEPSKGELQEQVRNRRYEAAVQKAQQRWGNLDHGFGDDKKVQGLDDIGNWQAGVQSHPVTGQSVCLIKSSSHTVQLGELATLVQLIVDKSTVYLRTDATLNQQADGVGFRVDNGEVFPIEHYQNELTGSTNQRYQTLLFQMALGQELQLIFRYSQQTETQANSIVRIALEGFTHELRILNACVAG